MRVLERKTYMTDMKPKFDIEKLNLHYGSFHALKDINMQISAHEITAFIGPSGCGKSTFLKTLNRMNDLVENVKIDGKVELDGQNIFKDMDAITLRHKVGMVFQQPEVLLMDEPTSALDPISTSKIEELAMELKGDYTIVIVTHNMQQATRISDKTAFFLLGEVVEFNDTDTLFSMPKDKRTEDYITGRFG